MASSSYVELKGSHRAPPTQAAYVGDLGDDETVTVSVYLKRKEDPAALASLDQCDQRRAALHDYRRDQYADDVALVLAFARDNGLTAVSVEPEKRLIRLSGPVRNLETAFRTKLANYQHADGHRFRGRAGTLSVPEDVANVVESVLGLDDRAVARHHLVWARSAQTAGYEPNKIGALYGFPTDATGKGQCIALIELGGGFSASDTKTAFAAMKLAVPSVVAVPVDGGKNAPSPGNDADTEVALDIQVAGGVAPGARIAVYFAPNSDAGFADAITDAAHDETNKPTVISISWGSAESQWTGQAITSMNSALQDAAAIGVSVFVASGDSLATDGVGDGAAHVDFPASSPYAIGCGGTEITVSGGKITAETVWNDGTSGTGGGISDLFPVPSFQSSVTLPPSVNAGRAGRGVPDVAGNAAPGSGYKVISDGKSGVVGGTSAVAPLWAGLTALLNEKASAPVGFFLDKLYPAKQGTREITSGNNRPTGSTIGYESGANWNACTGLGVPIGTALEKLLG
jgi:kumamolisin